MGTPTPGGNLGGQNALRGLTGSGAISGPGAAGGAPAGTYATGNFTWTVPGTPAPPMTGIERRLTAGGLIAPGTVGRTPAPGSYNEFTVGSALQGMTPEQFKALQQQLYNIRAFPDAFYGRNARDINWGKVGDLDTLQAFRGVLPYAMMTGNLDQILGATAPPGALAGAAGPVKQPLVIELPSREDMDAVLRESAKGLLGRDPTPDQFAAFAADFSSRVANYQRQAYTAGGSGLPGGPGGSVTKPPSGQAAAEEFLRKTAPTEVGAQKMEGGLGILLKMFGGGA
jgi:hypothetical protein